KDVVAHLTGWNRWLVARIQAALRGEPEPLPHWPAHIDAEDEINAWIYEANRGRSVGEVLDESYHVFQQLLAVIDGSPGEVRIETIRSSGREYHLVCADDKQFPAGEFFYHFHED